MLLLLLLLLLWRARSCLQCNAFWHHRASAAAEMRQYVCFGKGGALSQLESTIIPMAQILLGVVIYVNNKLLKISGGHLTGFLGGGVGGWMGPTQVFGHVL
jgi:hypothetical protein